MAGAMTNRAADHLARRLHAAGCRRAYGMPGGEVLTLVDALVRAGIEFVLCHHENAGGFMAEGGHHVDGAPAILVATVGPGVVNAANVVANAEQDRVPLIVLAGCVDAAEAERYTHQVLDHRAVLGPITKATFTLTAVAASVQADKAVRIALSGRMGPVLIDVPISVADAEAGGPEVALPMTAPGAIGADALATGRGWLRRAERPIVLAGLDAVKDGAGCAIRAFCEATGAPLVTTYKGKGLLDEAHPLALGGAGLSPLADGHLLPLLRAADLVVLAGYDPIEMRAGWRDAWDPTAQRVIDVAHAANNPRHARRRASRWPRRWARRSTRSATASSPARHGPVASPPPCGRRWPEPSRPTPGAPGPSWRPAARSARLERSPRSIPARIASCSARRGAATRRVGSFSRPGSARWAARCRSRSAWRGAAPGTPIVGFMGDAGFLMVAGELATAAALGVPVVLVVFVDASLALIELKQRQRQLPAAGVGFARTDCAAIARAFGGHGATVRDRDGLRDALRAAFVADRFTVIAAEIEAGAYDGRI